MFSNSTAFYSKTEHQDYRHYQCLSTVNLIFVFLTVTICVMSALAAFMNALLIRLLYRSKILHPNVRLLLKSLAIAVCLGSLFMFLKFTLYHPFLILVGFQRMLIKNTICALVELPFHVCSLALILSITGIGIERFSATIKQKSDSEKPGLGTKTILIGIWLVAFGNIIAGYLYAYANQTTMCYCHLSLVTTQRIFAVNTMFYVFIEISVLFLFWYVYYRNCKDYCNFTINTARHNLHARFQMINNVETTRTLLPVVVVHALFWTAYLLSLTFVRNFLDIKQQAMLKINCMLAVYHLLPLEMLIQPLLIVRRSEHLKKVALEMFPKLAPLWGSRQMTIVRYPHYQDKSCANTGATSSAFVRIPPTQSGEISVTTGLVSNAGACAAAASVVNMSSKRQIPPSNVESSVIDYRMRPEMHQDILEHIWSAKPISTDPLSSSTGAGTKRSSIKRGSLINRSKEARKQEQSSALMSNVDVENE